MSRLIFGMLLGGALVYGGMHYHVVRGQQGVFIVRKLESDLSALYTDIRDFTLQDWKSHPQLAAAIIQSNRSQLLPDAAEGQLSETVHTVVDRLFERLTL